MINFATSLHFIGLQANRKIYLNLLKKNLELNLEFGWQNNPFLVALLGESNTNPVPQLRGDLSKHLTTQNFQNWYCKVNNFSILDTKWLFL